MAHNKPYDHETLMYFWDRALDVFRASQPNAGFAQNTREINEKIKQIVDHLIYEYEKLVYGDYFQEGDFRLTHKQVVALMDRAVEILKVTKSDSNVNPSKQQIIERFHDIYENIVWQYHWYVKHDCKRKE